MPTLIANVLQHNLANVVYYSLKESTTSEQSARMTAMDNASKNASDDPLAHSDLQPHCQAMITKELIEIISGVAALDS